MGQRVTVLGIAAIGHPILRSPAVAVTAEELASPECQRFIDSLVETMRAANGAGIAANQVHDPRRISAIEVRPGNPRYPYKPPHPLTILINPRFVWLSDETYENNEGCLSVPDLRGDLVRPREAVVHSWDRSGAEVEHRFRGLTAGTAQHELDHLDGKIFVDRVTDSRTLSTWDQFNEHRRAQFERYIEQVVKETT